MSDSQSDDEEGNATTEAEEDVFGYSKKGSWDDVVEFAKEITRSFKDAGIDPDVVDEWEGWRPRSKEEEGKMREKTAEKAKTEKGKKPSEKAGEAAEHLSDTSRHTAEGDVSKAAEKATKSAKSAGEAAGGAGRSVLRTVEDWVYKNITTQTSPLYIDTESFNASLTVPTPIAKRIKGIVGSGSEEEYTLSINPESEDVEDALDETFGSEAESEISEEMAKDDDTDTGSGNE